MLVEIAWSYHMAAYYLCRIQAFTFSSIHMSSFFQSILLVDDDDITNFLHKTLLEDLNITSHIRVANTGKEALQLIQEQWQDDHEHVQENDRKLILLDINMPGMDGFEFLEVSKELDLHNTYVAMLSSSPLEADRTKASRYQVIDYIEKPLTRTKLQELFEKIER